MKTTKVNPVSPITSDALGFEVYKLQCKLLNNAHRLGDSERIQGIVDLEKIQEKHQEHMWKLARQVAKIQSNLDEIQNTPVPASY